MKKILVNEKLYKAYNESVNIAFAVDANYLNKLNVTILSILDNISHYTNYDIVIMHIDLSIENQKDFLESLPQMDNVIIRFLNIKEKFNEIDFKRLYIEIHVTVSTYFRFFIQEVFSEYEKVIYLDCDIVVLDDIKNLFNISLNGCFLGAALDIGVSLDCDIEFRLDSHRSWKNYVQETLGVKNYQQYFQAGVLLIDLSKMKNVDFKNRCLEFLSLIKTPILSDQDVLNAAFYNQVHNIPVRWNIEWNIPFHVPNYKKVMEKERLCLYTEALSNPAIIHYASSKKPWKYPNLKYSNIWWRYAEKSKYYNDFLLCIEDDRLVRIAIEVKRLLPVYNKPGPIFNLAYSIIKKIYKLFK